MTLLVIKVHKLLKATVNSNRFSNVPYDLQVLIRSMHFQALRIAKEGRVEVITTLMEDFAFDIAVILAPMRASFQGVIPEEQGEGGGEDSVSLASGISNHLPHPNLTESLRRGTNRS